MPFLLAEILNFQGSTHRIGVGSFSYIKNHFDSIKKYASVIENRLDDEWCTMESVLEDNTQFLEFAKRHNVKYVLIDDEYEIDIDLFQ